MGFKEKFLTVIVTVIIAIFALAVLNRLQVVNMTIDAMTGFVAALTAMLAVFVKEYIEK